MLSMGSLLFKEYGVCPYYSRFVLTIQGIWCLSLLFKGYGVCPYYLRDMVFVLTI